MWFCFIDWQEQSSFLLWWWRGDLWQTGEETRGTVSRDFSPCLKFCELPTLRTPLLFLFSEAQDFPEVSPGRTGLVSRTPQLGDGLAASRKERREEG